MILDGFPRTKAQAAALDAAFAPTGRRISAILLNVDVAILTARLTGRRICSGCGRPYHVEHRPPAVADRCDACGSALITRSDDAPATVAARLEHQLAALADVVEVYRASGRLKVVEGVGEIAAIQSQLVAAAAAVGFAS